MKIVAVIQARTGSTRLPNKVLLPALGQPLLAWMVARVQFSVQIDDVVVATTTLPEDEPIRTLAAAAGVRCISGDPVDLLDRHLQAARHCRADAVVKIPSDCPLIDPRIIDQVVGTYRRHRSRYDFVSNLHPATWPDGNDVEVMPTAVLEQAWDEATRPFEREHTTPFIWDRPARFRIGNVAWADGRDLSASLRLTLDYDVDYQLIVALIEALHRPGLPPFSLEAIVAHLDANPQLAALNARHAGTSWVDHHRHELYTTRLAPADQVMAAATADATEGATAR